MNDLEFFTPAQVERLIRGVAISDREPWASGDERLIDDHLRTTCSAVTASTGTESTVELHHHGSGYASYVDAWFYRDSADFAVRSPLGFEHEHTGLVILLSRLSPYFVFMEGERRWHAQGASSYLPAFDAVDKLETPAVVELAKSVQPVLERHGMLRLSKDQLSLPLAPDLRAPTILADGPFRQFDALFHWED